MYVAQLFEALRYKPEGRGFNYYYYYYYILPLELRSLKFTNLYEFSFQKNQLYFLLNHKLLSHSFKKASLVPVSCLLSSQQVLEHVQFSYNNFSIPLSLPTLLTAPLTN
jgi:hypothetical protein